MKRRPTAATVQCTLLLTRELCDDALTDRQRFMTNAMHVKQLLQYGDTHTNMDVMQCASDETKLSDCQLADGHAHVHSMVLTHGPLKQDRSRGLWLTAAEEGPRDARWRGVEISRRNAVNIMSTLVCELLSADEPTRQRRSLEGHENISDRERVTRTLIFFVFNAVSAREKSLGSLHGLK